MKNIILALVVVMMVFSSGWSAVIAEGKDYAIAEGKDYATADHDNEAFKAGEYPVAADGINHFPAPVTDPVAKAAKTADAEYYEKLLYTSYIEGRMYLWTGIIDGLEIEYRQGGNHDILYTLAFALYGYTGYFISEDKKENAEETLEKALEYTKELEKIHRERHDILALHGALLGYKMVLSKFSAPLVGPRALKKIKTASESADSCFNCAMEMGNMLYFTPPIVGGSKEKALVWYEKALTLYNRAPEGERRNWLYINASILVGQAYTETGSPEKACELYRELLSFEPRAKWIRDDLMSECVENQ